MRMVRCGVGGMVLGFYACAAWAQGQTGTPAGGFTLEQAFQAALQKNEIIRQNAERLSQSEARVWQGWGRLFPELSASAVHLIQPLPADPVAQAFSPAEQTTVTLTAVQPIFKGMKEYAGIRQQRERRNAQEAQQKLAQQRLYQEVSSGYLNVLTLEQDVRNLQEQVAIYERRVEELKGRTQRGESSATELLSAQASYHSLRAELRLTEGQLHVARESFASLTGQARDVQLVDPQLVPAQAPALEKYLERIEQRPDVQSAVADGMVADAGILFAVGGHLPTVDVVGNYYPMRPGFLKDLRWDVSIRASMPIFSGGVTTAETREAISRSREADLEIARVRRMADQEIRGLHENLRARLEHLSFLKQSVELAEKNVAVSQNDYRRGLTRNIDVQMALSEYRNMRRSLDQAHFAVQNDQLKLELASGEKPGEKQ